MAKQSLHVSFFRVEIDPNGRMTESITKIWLGKLIRLNPNIAKTGSNLRGKVPHKPLQGDPGTVEWRASTLKLVGDSKWRSERGSGVIHDRDSN